MVEYRTYWDEYEPAGFAEYHMASLADILGFEINEGQEREIHVLIKNWAEEYKVPNFDADYFSSYNPRNKTSSKTCAHLSTIPCIERKHLDGTHPVVLCIQLKKDGTYYTEIHGYGRCRHQDFIMEES